MQKLTEIIGKANRSRSTADYNIAYSWHTNQKIGHRTFQVSLSQHCLRAMRYEDGDRADISVDLESGIAILTLSKDGDFGLSGKGTSRTTKLASKSACEALAKMFRDAKGIQPMETISISGRSITFNLPAPKPESI
jgi:hypothetical protein